MRDKPAQPAPSPYERALSILQGQVERPDTTAHPAVITAAAAVVAHEDATRQALALERIASALESIELLEAR